MVPEWQVDDPYISVGYLFPTFASAIAYGIILCLSVACVRAIRKGSQYSTRRRRVLYLYIALVLVLSTVSLAEGFTIVKGGVNGLLSLTDGQQPPDWTFTGSSIAIAFDFDLLIPPFALWAADGFMTWRCIALYEGISKWSRYILLCALALLCSTSLAFGILSLSLSSFLPFLQTRLGPYNTWSWALMCASAGINLILSTLIVLRIRYHQRYIQKTLGTKHGSIYTRVMVMCVESCAMIWMCDLLYIIASCVKVRGNGWVDFPLVLLPQICVISPLLIIYRVAMGSDTATQTINVSNVVRDGVSRAEANIAFRPMISTSRSEA